MNRGLSCYRSLFRAIRKLPEARLMEAKVRARHEFRANRALDGHQLEHAFKQAQKSLEYVEMLTPKVKRHTAGRYVIGPDGELVHKGDEDSSRPGLFFGTERKISSDDMKRHHQLLRRQHFMDRK